MDINDFLYEQEYNNQPFVESDINQNAETWDEFLSKARKIMSDGLTECLPCDEPKHLRLGYIFSTPGDKKAIRLSFRIGIVMKTVPEDIKQKYFKNERGRLNLVKMFKAEREK